MLVIFGADHAGYELKETLKSYVLDLGYEIKDMGAYSFEETDDYPDFIVPVAKEVSKNPDSVRGVVLGGSGQGEAIVANRFTDVRAVVFLNPSVLKNKKNGDDEDDVIRLSREHNDSNVLSLGANFLTEEQAKKAVSEWLKTPFSEEERHLRRIKKIDLKNNN